MRWLGDIALGILTGACLLVIFLHIEHWLEEPAKPTALIGCEPIPDGERCYYQFHVFMARGIATVTQTTAFLSPRFRPSIGTARLVNAGQRAPSRPF